MPRKPVTDRSIRAMKTKKKLFQSAEKLVAKYGYDNVTIEDICRKAGVSVGAYYHYYNSKSDIIVEFFKEIDLYYEEKVNPNFSGAADSDIDIFFQYYAMFHVDQGCDHTSMIIRVQSDFYLDKTRYMYKKLIELVNAAQATGTFSKDPDPALIADYLLIVARGMLFDWVLTHGEYDLIAKMGAYIKLAKKSFL